MAFKGFLDEITGTLTSLTQAITPLAQSYIGYKAIETVAEAGGNPILSLPQGVNTTTGAWGNIPAPSGTKLPNLQKPPSILGLDNETLLLLGGGALLLFGSIFMIKQSKKKK